MTSPPLDTTFMALAIKLAVKGRGRTNPNPMVGAVVVAGGRVVGRGYHRRVGGPHAEVEALEEAGRLARGATLYVSLEPCSHTRKRTPPCVPLIVRSGIIRVVAAMTDPNPRVQGRGVRALRGAGVSVDVGCMKREAERLNQAYCHRQRTGRPFVTLKAGMTLDGKIGTARGESRWITGAAARRHVHRMRSVADAVMVGIGTVLQDDPRLTARLGRPVRQPLRIVLDSGARIPLTARLLKPAMKAGTLIVATTEAPSSRVRRLRTGGTNVLLLPPRRGRVPLRRLLDQLGRLGITDLLLEGGSELNAAMVKEGLVNRVMLFVSPTLLGGRDARGLLGGTSPERLAESRWVSDVTVRRMGPDFLIEGNME